jgi:hypothetical protein
MRRRTREMPMDDETDNETNYEAAHAADELEILYAKTLYALRESRKTMLGQYGVDDEAALLDQIRSGELAEHPAYEHYLGALIIGQTRMHVRAQAVQQLLGGEAGAKAEAKAGIEAETSLHLMLRDRIGEHYAHRLSEPVRLAQDALLVSFDSGVTVELRYYSAHKYSVGWRWGDATLRIDSAPVHADCATFPHHLHDDRSTRCCAIPCSRIGGPLPELILSELH